MNQTSQQNRKPARPDPLDEYVALTLELRELTAQQEAIKKRLAALEEPLIEGWAERGIEHVATRHGTLYVRKDFYCSKKSGVDTPQILRVLRDCGLGSMEEPTYNAARLKAQVREWTADGTDYVPHTLRQVLKYDYVPRLVLRGG